MTRSIEIPSEKPALVVIAGPTAAGKSAVALDLAITQRGTVINADASQLYADLRVLSARPGAADLAAAPHRLYGIADGAEAWSAARWAVAARIAIAAARDDGRLPIVVGGTGLYLRTLLDGIAPVPPIDPAVRAEVRALDRAAAYFALRAEDPDGAAALAAGDTQRIARALEVVRSTGRALRDWQHGVTGGIAGEVTLRAIVVDRPRAELHARIDARLDTMLAEGALAEVAALASRGLAPDLPVMKALGVPPLLDALRGTISLDEALAATRLDTRRFVKRQQTWFRNQTPDWERWSEGDDL